MGPSESRQTKRGLIPPGRYRDRVCLLDMTVLTTADFIGLVPSSQESSRQISFAAVLVLGL